jgi:hypothetical protein
MSIVNKDEIKGYRIDDRIYCCDCFEELSPEPELTVDCLITEASDEERFCFCDECSKKF